MARNWIILWHNKTNSKLSVCIQHKYLWYYKHTHANNKKNFASSNKKKRKYDWEGQYVIVKPIAILSKFSGKNVDS